MNYIVFDLDEIREDLGAHWITSKKDTYPGICGICNEEVPQTVDECPVCGEPVVWKNSKVWRRKFGSPTVAIRKLDIVKPVTKAGRLACARAGVNGFANKTEAKRFKRCVNKLGEEKMTDLVEKCSESTRGRGILSFAMNWAEKIIREEDVEQAPNVIDISL